MFPVGESPQSGLRRKLVCESLKDVLCNVTFERFDNCCVVEEIVEGPICVADNCAKSFNCVTDKEPKLPSRPLATIDLSPWVKSISSTCRENTAPPPPMPECSNAGNSDPW